MTKEEAIAYIDNYTWSTSKMGLSRTVELLNRLGNPQKKLKFVHVTGSNGKGSTCSMVESVLRLAGYRTGLYTSPYVCDFNERIQVNRVNITDEELAEITERVSIHADAMEDHPSQFELLTAIAMCYFAEQNCEIVVLEVGMGGAMDSTNVIDAPEVAAFTNIGLEHTEYLGNTICEIATTKGGIIKSGCRVVCYDSEEEAVQTIRRICEEKQVEFTLASGREAVLESADIHGQCFVYNNRRYKIGLLGNHQVSNAVVAIEIIESLRKCGYAISDRALDEGLLCAEWPARLEVLSEKPLFILDGGHNPQCAQALVDSLKSLLSGEKVVFLTGVLADKDYHRMVQIIKPFAKSCICVTVDNPRALSGAEYAKVMRDEGIEATYAPGLEDAVRLAIESAQDSPIVAFGSLYMAGEIRRIALRILG